MSGSMWATATRSSSPSTRSTSTAHQSATSGTARRATRSRTSSGSSDEASRRLLSERKRSASSERLCAVMSSITLIAIRRKPSSSHTGVDLTTDQRSSPVARTRKRIIASAVPSPERARRPGSSSTGKGRPDSE